MTVLSILNDVSATLLHADHTHVSHSFALFAGLAAAVLHVVSGPDHLAAVTPLAVESRTKVWRIGFVWGAGHLIGMLIIGGLFFLFREYLPLDAISAYSEQLVAVVLIGIGLWALFTILRTKKRHSHPHIHVGEEPYLHVHEHNHEVDGATHAHIHAKKEKQNLWSSFGIGLLHGLAGVAHFILLLPVLGFEHKSESIQYIVGFGIGTILAMTVYTFALGLIAKYSKRRGGRPLFQFVRFTGGIFALVVGVYWLYLTF